jgi:phosphohistidine phosphatase SixA
MPHSTPPLRTVLLCAVLTAVNAFAQPPTASLAGTGTIFLVRHAERADAGSTPATDPSLSDIGRARATSLATLLKDAGITAIIVTEFKRTGETAAPLAQALAITPTVIASKDLAGLISKLKTIAGNVLVVGHSNTLPAVLQGLGLTSPVIGDEDFDNLFILTPAETASGVSPRRVVRLHYH